MVEIIDTHAHLEGEEFADDLEQVVCRAQEAGVVKAFLPSIHLESVENILKVCDRFPHFAYPMVGLHPEEVKDDFREVLSIMKSRYLDRSAHSTHPFIAIGEVGLDYYWSREFEKQQLEAFEEQVRWSVETQLPLMIHCRKAQNELVKILRKYETNLPGGVFHCFTGNEIEARELLSFERFVLGIGGVLTFKKSHLPEVLPTTVPPPQIRYPDYYGIDMPRLEEFCAFRATIELLKERGMHHVIEQTYRHCLEELKRSSEDMQNCVREIIFQ